MRPQTRPSTLLTALAAVLLLLAGLPAASSQAVGRAQNGYGYTLFFNVFAYPPRVLEPISFQANFIDYSLTSPRSATNFSWNFGDGSEGSGQSPTHTYSAPGNYTVTLTASLSDGSVVSTSQPLAVSGIEINVSPLGELNTLSDGYFNIAFSNFFYQPTCTWDFGDNTAPATAPCGNYTQSTTHRYAADATYTVKVDITLAPGLTTTATRAVVVSTHDVAVTRVVVPNSARVNQSRDIVVSLANQRQDESQVLIELFVTDVGGGGYPGPGSNGGFRLVASSTQYVAARPRNRTTDVTLSYTFTKQDAALGKVNFKVRATIVNRTDAIPSNNEFTSLPVTVR